MATLRPFRALRPKPSDAARVCRRSLRRRQHGRSARAGGGQPAELSARVARRDRACRPAPIRTRTPSISTPPPISTRLRKTSLVRRGRAERVLLSPAHGRRTPRLGLAACFSIDEYDRDIIKKHERTRRDKEDDRTRHMIALGAQTGPVFLTYRASAEVDRIAERVTPGAPDRRFRGAGRRASHALARRRRRSRRAGGGVRSDSRALYRGRPSSCRQRRSRPKRHARSRASGTSLGDGADYSTLLAVAFPHDQVQVLPYNRIVKDLGGLLAGRVLAVGS